MFESKDKKKVYTTVLLIVVRNNNLETIQMSIGNKNLHTICGLFTSQDKVRGNHTTTWILLT